MCRVGNLQSLLIVLAGVILLVTACSSPATPTAEHTEAPTEEPPPTTISLPTVEPVLPTAVPPAIPTATNLPLTEAGSILNQTCTPTIDTQPASFAACTEGYCCETSAHCEDDPECQQAAACFMENGGMRGYEGISACYEHPGADAYMDLFACRFQFCGEYMTLNEGEHCLRDKCVIETVGCFSNPDCFALKFCIADRVASPEECRVRHPEGQADFNRWQTCGRSTGCFDLMP